MPKNSADTDLLKFNKIMIISGISSLLKFEPITKAIPKTIFH
jgi:hypothetical protein